MSLFAAYIYTTVSTVCALLSAFFAGQQTFCFLQLQNNNNSMDHKTSIGNNDMNNNSNNRSGKGTFLQSGFDDEELLTKVKQ